MKRRSPRFSGSWFAVVGDDADADVGVQVNVVGLAVVAIVLVHPPPVAHAQQDIAGDDPDQLVLPLLVEHLVVAGVVELEAELPGDDSEEHGVQRPQPRVGEQE